MKNFLAKVLFGLAFIACAMRSDAADIPFTANLRQYTNNPARAYLLLTLKGCTDSSGNELIPTVNGSATIGLSSQKLYPNGVGLVSASITPREDITCGSTVGGTKYLIEIWEIAGPGLTRDRRIAGGQYIVTAPSFSLNNAAPTTDAAATAPNAVLTNPGGTQNIASGSTGSTPLEISGRAGQTADLFQVRDNLGVPWWGFSATGYADVKKIAAPGNPASGYNRVYMDTATGLWKCKASDGSDCNPASGGGGGGSGTVINVSTGNLAPLFTASVANPTTTPALSFGLSNAAANAVFAGPSTGSPAAPSYRQLGHSELSGIGTNTHAQIDAHIAATTSVHGSTSANTASAIVQRGASGEFAAGAITATDGSPDASAIVGNSTVTDGSEGTGVFGQTHSRTGEGVAGVANPPGSPPTGAETPVGVLGVSFNTQGPGVMGRSNFSGTGSSAADPTIAVPVGVSGVVDVDSGYAGLFDHQSTGVGKIAVFRKQGVEKVYISTGGNVSITGQYQVSGVQISTADLSNGANIVTSFVNDTNVTASLVGHVATLGWAGTLAAGRLNSNVVQAVTNDTNITGTISAQNLTFVWSGTLAKARQHAQTVYQDANATFSNALVAFSGPSSRFTLPNLASYSPTLSGELGYDTTTNTVKGGFNGSTKIFATLNDLTIYVPTTTAVNTTSPITGGGDLSVSRTIACASCVTASSPGVGIAHFAGSTQAVTSSAVDVSSADVTGVLKASAMPALTGAITNSAGSLTTSPGKADVLDAVNFCLDAGSTDAYACSLSPAITGYVTGTHYRFKANTANTGAATINLNSVAVKTIVKVAGGITTTLADNDIRAGQWVDLVYDGTNMQVQSTLGNAAAGGSGYATILDEGSNLTQRSSVNMIGSGVTCVDNSGSTRTDCTFPAGLSVLDVDTTPVTETNSATETDLITYTLPANELELDESLLIEARGVFTASGSPNLQWRIYFGSTVMATGTWTSNAQTNQEWVLSFRLVAKAAPGASVTCEGQGYVLMTNTMSIPLANTGTLTLATNTSQVIKVSVDWTGANAGDTVQQRQFFIKTEKK
jgi:hypothetical protein